MSRLSKSWSLAGPSFFSCGLGCQVPNARIRSEAEAERDVASIRNKTSHWAQVAKPMDPEELKHQKMSKDVEVDPCRSVWLLRCLAPGCCTALGPPCTYFQLNVQRSKVLWDLNSVRGSTCSYSSLSWFKDRRGECERMRMHQSCNKTSNSRQSNKEQHRTMDHRTDEKTEAARMEWAGSTRVSSWENATPTRLALAKMGHWKMLSGYQCSIDSRWFQFIPMHVLFELYKDVSFQVVKK